MDADKFNKWKASHQYTTEDIAELFEISPLLVSAYESGEVIIPAVVCLACDYVKIIDNYQKSLELRRFSSSIEKRYRIIGDIQGKILYDTFNEKDRAYIRENNRQIRTWLNLNPHDTI